MTSDTELLRSYALQRAEPAFEEFVRRNLPMVYSAALRTLSGDTHAAEDVTQVVFCTTARQAQRLSQHPSLNAWLHTATRNAAIDFIRAERRRRTREQEAHSMPDQPIDITSAADWSRLAPVLDAAVGELRDDDREAVLLRFFQNRRFAEIGASLGLSEDAARKRVDRALEKLRALLQQRGLRSTSEALAAVLASGTLSAAPAGLVTTVASAAIATSAATLGTAAVIGVTKLQIGLAAAVVAAGGLGLVLQQRDKAELRETAAATRRELARRSEETAQLSQASQATEAKLQQAVAARAAAEDEAKRLRSELAALHARSSGSTAQSRKEVAPAAAQAPGPLPDTPEIARRKAAWHRRYEAFFRAQGMSATDADRFVELKVHQELARADFQAAVRAAQLRGDSPAVQALRNRDDSGVTRALLDLLGPERYAAYGAYEKLSAYRGVYLEPLGQAMAAAHVPLSPPQADRLLELVSAAVRTYHARPTDIGSTFTLNWSDVTGAAREVLSPAQCAVLDAYARQHSAGSGAP